MHGLGVHSGLLHTPAQQRKSQHGGSQEQNLPLPPQLRAGEHVQQTFPQPRGHNSNDGREKVRQEAKRRIKGRSSPGEGEAEGNGGQKGSGIFYPACFHVASPPIRFVLQGPSYGQKAPPLFLIG